VPSKNSRSRVARKSPNSDGRMQHSDQVMRNLLLLDLPRDVRKSVLKLLEYVRLPIRTVLCEMGKPIQHA